MGNKIGQNRYIFTESLAFVSPKTKKESYALKEILRLIPIVSILVEARELSDTIKKRSFYKEHKQEGYIYDVRFSSLSIAKHAVNLIGLGILILPFRSIATAMRENDIANSKECENPHFLDYWKMNTCMMINANQQAHYEGILKYCPEEDDYCKRMAFRDHVKYPEYLLKSLYEDPFEKSSDQPIKDQIIKSRNTDKWQKYFEDKKYKGSTCLVAFRKVEV